MSKMRSCSDCGWARAQWCECPVPKIGWGTSNEPPENRIDLDNPSVDCPCWVRQGVPAEAKPEEPNAEARLAAAEKFAEVAKGDHAYLEHLYLTLPSNGEHWEVLQKIGAQLGASTAALRAFEEAGK